MNREKAARLHAVISAGREMVDDKTASIAPELYGRLKLDGSLVKAGTRINWDGVLKRAAVDLWDYAENDPDHAPELWEEIAYKEGYRVLLGPISASNPVMPGEMCWEQGDLYKCIYHTACTYRPSEYALAWEKVEA